MAHTCSSSQVSRAKARPSLPSPPQTQSRHNPTNSADLPCLGRPRHSSHDHQWELDLVGKFPNFPYQACSQPWILHVSVDSMLLPGMVFSQFWSSHVLAGTAAQPSFCLDLVLRYVSGYCSLRQPGLLTTPAPTSVTSVVMHGNSCVSMWVLKSHKAVNLVWFACWPHLNFSKIHMLKADNQRIQHRSFK